MPSCWSAPQTKDAYRLSLVSLIAEIGAIAAGISLFMITGSVLCLVLGLENCVDFLGSAFVLWRFFAPFSMDSEVERRLQRREKRASMAISFILILLGIVILATAIDDFARGQDEVSDAFNDIIGISFVSFLVFGVLTAFKFHYAIALESASLHKDGLCSLIGTILSGTLFINTLIVQQYPSTWWIDPVVAFGCGLAAIALGCNHLYVAKYRDKIPIFTLRWWFTSQGDGKDETSGRPVGPEDLELTTTTTAADHSVSAEQREFHDKEDDHDHNEII